MPAALDGIITPAAIVDLDRMAANLERMARYTAEHGLALRPHTKTHKTPHLGAEQLRLGAVGLTVATLREAHIMAAVCDDLLIAHPPVGPAKLHSLLSLPEHVRVTVALDDAAVLAALSNAAAAHGRTIGVLIEMDLGMHRVGVQTAAQTVALARAAQAAPGIEYRGVLFYPGHIRAASAQQEAALSDLDRDLAERLEALRAAGAAPGVVSAGSTPTAFASHRIRGITEIRPGTYIFNDRTTAEIGACRWEDCSYTILATVVSTAVPGQAVVDAGSKALSKEELRAEDASGYGALFDRPEVVVKALSEEHGLLDLTRTDWRPQVGERVRIVPNHVCVSVNLQPFIYGMRAGEVERQWSVLARGWDPVSTLGVPIHWKSEFVRESLHEQEVPQ